MSDDKKEGMTDEELRDYKDGVEGVDHDGLFTDRSAANSEGLKEHIKIEAETEAKSEDDE